MARDFNLAIISGELTKEPSIRPIKNSKTMLVFTLKVVERFELRDGSPASHINLIDVEVLGRHVDSYLNSLRVGKRYQVTGYLRVDDMGGDNRVRVRCYNLQSDD